MPGWFRHRSLDNRRQPKYRRAATMAMKTAATRMSNNILSAKKAPTASIKPPRILTNISYSHPLLERPDANLIIGESRPNDNGWESRSKSEAGQSNRSSHLQPQPAGNGLSPPGGATLSRRDGRESRGRPLADGLGLPPCPPVPASGWRGGTIATLPGRAVRGTLSFDPSVSLRKPSVI